MPMPFEFGEELTRFLSELAPDDVGHDTIGAHLVFYEGFTEMCLDDLDRRQALPATDPRHVPAGGPVGNAFLESEMLSGWSARAPGAVLLASGWCGDEDNPTFYAIYESAPEGRVTPLWQP